MDEKAKELLEEAIKLEMNMSELYLFYHRNFEEAEDFWMTLAKEERHHAALLEFGKDFFQAFPEEIIYQNIEEMKKANKKIEKTLMQYREEIPSKKDAYQFAIDLENSAYELHYQQLLDNDPETKEMKVLQKLNEDDKDHAGRIRGFLAQDSK